LLWGLIRRRQIQGPRSPKPRKPANSPRLRSGRPATSHHRWTQMRCLTPRNENSSSHWLTSWTMPCLLLDRVGRSALTGFRDGVESCQDVARELRSPTRQFLPYYYTSWRFSSLRLTSLLRVASLTYLNGRQDPAASLSPVSYPLTTSRQGPKYAYLASFVASVRPPNLLGPNHTRLISPENRWRCP